MPEALAATPPRFLSRDDLRARGITYHRHHLRRLWERGEFPAPVKLSERKLAWVEADIEKWSATKCAGRGA